MKTGKAHRIQFGIFRKNDEAVACHLLFPPDEGSGVGSHNHEGAHTFRLSTTLNQVAAEMSFTDKDAGDNYLMQVRFKVAAIELLEVEAPTINSLGELVKTVK